MMKKGVVICIGILGVWLVFWFVELRDYEFVGDVTTKHRIVHPKAPEFLGHALARRGLKKLDLEGSVRFLWSRSFHPTILFEVSKLTETRRLLIVKRRTSFGWKVLKRKVLREGADRLPSSTALVFIEKPQYTERDLSVADGASWIFEMVYDGEHRWIWRQSPPLDSEVGRWGMSFIESAIDSPLMPIY